MPAPYQGRNPRNVRGRHGRACHVAIAGGSAGDERDGAGEGTDGIGVLQQFQSLPQRYANGGDRRVAPVRQGPPDGAVVHVVVNNGSPPPPPARTQRPCPRR